MNPYFTVGQQIKAIAAVTPIQLNHNITNEKESRISVIINLPEFERKFEKEMRMKEIRIKSGYNVRFFNLYPRSCCINHLTKEIVHSRDFKMLVAGIFQMQSSKN